MLVSEYLALHNRISVTTGNSTAGVTPQNPTEEIPEGESFAQALKQKLEERQTAGVSFSKHALQRLEERSIDVNAGNTLERLNKAVELAAGKGSSETLVLVDNTAFVVSVKNNKVITTLTNDDLTGNIFTNIDSTVIM